MLEKAAGTHFSPLFMFSLQAHIVPFGVILSFETASRPRKHTELCKLLFTACRPSKAKTEKET